MKMIRHDTPTLAMLVSAVTVALVLLASFADGKGLRHVRQTEDVGPGPVHRILDDLGGRKEVDFVLVLDRSKSMSMETFYLRSKKMARQILVQYATLDPDYVRLSVIVFSEESFVAIDGISNPDSADSKCSLFSDGDNSIWDTKVSYSPTDNNGGTNVRAAYIQAQNIFVEGRDKRPDASRVLLIITDAQWDTNSDPKDYLLELTLLDVNVYGMGLGAWLSVGAARVITSQPEENVYLYAGYSHWENMLLGTEERRLLSYDSDTQIAWRQEFPEFCNDSCPDYSKCYCDIDKGYETCLCDAGYYYNSTDNVCTVCPEDTYKDGFGNSDTCRACPPDTTSPEGAISSEECVCPVNVTCEDPCTADPCNYTNEICQAINSTDFLCACAEDWEGDNCAVNHDACADGSAQCVDQSVCVDGQGAGVYTCVCKENAWGYSGRYCTRNMDECTPDVCQNNANCTDAYNNFQCDCTIGFDGRHCTNIRTTPIPTTSTVTTVPTTTPTTTQAATTPSTGDDKTLWIIIGASVGGGIIIIIIVVVACVICRKRKDQSQEEVKDIAEKFSGFWKKKTMRGNKYADAMDGLPSAPTRHRPDILSNTNVQESVENLKTDEYTELPYETLTLKTGMESWQNYLAELEESSIIARGLMVKSSGDKKASTTAWMYEPLEQAQLKELMEFEQVHVPVHIQDGEYLITENDGSLAQGRTMGEDMDEAQLVIIGKTRTYLVVIIANAHTDSGKARKEVQWIVDHISGEGY